MLKQQVITVESLINDPNEDLLHLYGKKCQHVSRILFNVLTHNEVTNDIWRGLKKTYIEKYKIHARLFNSCWTYVNSQIASLET